MAEAVSGTIGVVSDTDGPVTVLRADGSMAEAEPGTEIFPGDTVITGDGGAAFVTLADGGEVRLDEFGEMVVDGADAVTVNAGAFVVIAEGSVMVQTPSAVVTVDGATLVGLARPDGEESAFTLLPNEDGSLGLVEVATEAGAQLLLQPYQTTTTVALAVAPGPVVLVGETDFSDLYADALGILGDLGVRTAAGNEGEAVSGPAPLPVDFTLTGLDVEREDLFSILFDEAGGRVAALGIGGGRQENIFADELPQESGTAEASQPRSFLAEDETESAAGAEPGRPDPVFFEDMAEPFGDLTGIGDLHGGGGDDDLSGSDDDDILFGDDGADTVSGGGGNDFLFGDDPEIFGVNRGLPAPDGDGNDTLFGGEGNDYLEGNYGDDALDGGAGDDSYVWGQGWGRDSITDAEGNDRLGLFRDFGGGFNSAIMASPSLDVVGGVGITATCVVQYSGFGMMFLPVDVIAYRDGDDLVIDDLTTAADDGVRIRGHYLPGQSIEEIAFDDFLLTLALSDSTTAGDDMVFGGGTLDGGDGRDALYGDAADDDLDGGAERDFLSGSAGADTLFGGLGDDYLDGGAGADALDGGDGLDWLSAAADPSGIHVDLAAGSATDGWGAVDSLAGIENVPGSAHGDVILGDGASNEFLGHDGNDRLAGRGGTDFLWGLAGADTLEGGDGRDVLVGDFGALVPHGSADPGNDVLLGGAGDDFLFGNHGDDALFGGSGDDTLFGEFGNDSLFGGDGSDFLRDGRGTNVLDGGAGDDHVLANGDNLLIGGIGFDTVYYASATDVVGRAVDIDLASGTATAAGIAQSLSGFEAVVGTQSNDTIAGDDQRNVLRGLGGDDAIDGRDGDDVLMGGGGVDTLLGAEGNDVLNGGSDGDSLQGGLGSDFYIVGATETLAGTGDDCGLSLSATFSRLSLSDPDGFVLTPNGLAADDVDVIVDAGGAFDALGFASHAWVDFLSELEALMPERISATRDGDDLILRDTDATGIVLDDFGREVEFTVEAGADVIDHYGEGQVEYFVFETQPDHVFAFGEAGSEESDFLVGGDLAELIDGGEADDLLFGNGGDDTLVGGTGDDTLRGGEGGDRFVLDGNDVISDFSVADGDILDLEAGLGSIAFADSAAGLTMTVADAFTVTLIGLDSTNVDAAFLGQIEV